MDTFRKIGEMDVKDTIMATDPCYSDDSGICCHLKVTNMQPGKYNCYIRYREKNSDSLPVSILLILAEGPAAGKALRLIHSSSRFAGLHYAGSLPVDSGTIGFFNGEKPNFSDTEWYSLCDWMQEQDRENKSVGDVGNWYVKDFGDVKGCWCGTAYGDGEYPMGTMEDDGKTIAAVIQLV